MRAKGERGFTLVEILVALTVTIIALAGLLTLHATSVSSNETTAELTRATEIGTRTMEDLRGLSVQKIMDDFGGGTLPMIAVELTPVQDRGLTYRRFIWMAESSPDPDLVVIRVEVRWTRNGAATESDGGFYDYSVPFELVRTKADAL